MCALFRFIGNYQPDGVAVDFSFFRNLLSLQLEIADIVCITRNPLFTISGLA